jgi:hypothetical protein
LLPIAGRPIWKYLRQTSWPHLTGYIAAAIALLVPLVWGLINEPSQLQLWLGLPSDLTVIEGLRQLAAVPLHLMVRGPEAPLLWLGHRPILDVFTVVMALIGTFWLLRHAKAHRLTFLLITGLLAWIICALRPIGLASLSLIVPVLYFAATAGIQVMLRRWLEIFPRNPFAKWLAYGLLAVVVSGSVLLSTREYFVAWPNNTETRQQFNIKP